MHTFFEAFLSVRDDDGGKWNVECAASRLDISGSSLSKCDLILRNISSY